MHFKDGDLKVKTHLLTPGDIHIWCIPRTQSLSQIQELSQLLSEAERIRVRRFRFEKDQHNFVIKRGFLRKLLGDYLNTDPRKLQFFYGDHGKPELINTFGNANIHFNLSHSGGFILYALTFYQRIGIDIEYIYDVPEINQIAEIILSEIEYPIFQTLPEADKKEAFFHYWTRKEAITKAIGIGLSQPLNSITTSIFPGEPARLIKLEGDEKKTSSWFVQSLNLLPDYAAALAAESNEFELKIYYNQNI